MDRRAKLLGMDRMNVNVSLAEAPSSAGQIKVSLAGAEKAAAEIDVHSPEEDAKRLIGLMMQAGILPSEELAAIASRSGVIVDAEILEQADDGSDGSDE